MGAVDIDRIDGRFRGFFPGKRGLQTGSHEGTKTRRKTGGGPQSAGEIGPIGPMGLIVPPPFLTEALGGVDGGTQEGAFVVQNHLDGHLLQEGAETSFVEEGLEESAILESRKDLRGDSTADVHSAGGLEVEGQVSRRRPVNVDELFEG